MRGRFCVEEGFEMKKTFFTLTAATCLIYSINGGVRGNFGILLQPIADNSGLTYAEVSFVLAVSQLLFGGLQPLVGIAALKFSERSVMICGSILMAAGFLLTPFCHSLSSLTLVLGVMLGAGTAMLSFGLMLGIISPQMSQENSLKASGFLNASSGIGTTVLAPTLQFLIATIGLLGTMMFLGAPAILFLPISLWLCRGIRRSREKSSNQNGLHMIRDAWKDRNYRFLVIGFSTCGFHMAILETHFFSQLTTFGFTRDTAALLFMLYGIFTMVGSALSGFLCTKIRMKIVLGSLYATRVILAIIILTIPANLWMLAIFMFFLGLTSDSTVSPTSGLMLKNFGAIKLATLLGIAFACHQVGCFFSAWAGGIIVTDFGNYDLLWIGDAILSLLAAVVSFRVREV